ncbi:calcineurin-like phosphoesterase C-terminal domain-containing protein [Corynebacterium yudongzhengii]|uniref:calcineurin-like phosphoesterase C-terminal domain-containing protein n=1 Tax=Corynebacterium yudongzhengii TaxID=2080740 RepID=UPI0018EE56F6|nr:calcineurin-like phosphoesterase family protein [Corynebacterium yudongzhengii]
MPGVAVSNGADIVTTDDEGRYEIPVDDNTTVFITQPSGYQVPVDEHNVAQFYYNHVPEGSPELRYGGLEATGPTPEAVNFPLTVSEQAAAPEQNCIIGGDVQTYDQDEVGYAANGAFRDLAERDDYTECGALFIGDVVGDDLSLYPEIRELTAGINGPARFLPGNHDLDFDAESDEHKFATYRQQFGPEYYSYDVGNAHIISLESVEYPVSDGEYNGAIDDEQMEWLRQDIANTPEDKLIVLASHIPLVGFADYSSTQHQIDQFTEIAELVEGRETIAVSGHAHAVANLREGDSLSGWKEVHGIDGLPFTNVVAGGISGDWYSGKMGDDGYPLSYGRDGSKPGVLTLEINDNQVSEYFTVVGGDQSDQMNIGLNTPAYREWFDKHVEYEDSNAENTGPVEPFAHPNAVPVEDLAETYLTTNFWMGSTGSEVTVSFDGGEAVPAERTQPMQGEEQYAGAEYSDPVAVQEQLVHGGSIADRAAHIWCIPLPEGLEEGTHTAEVTATDVHGRSFTETYEFTVGAESSDSVESFLPGSSGSSSSSGSSGSSGSSLLGSSFSS